MGRHGVWSNSGRGRWWSDGSQDLIARLTKFSMASSAVKFANQLENQIKRKMNNRVLTENPVFVPTNAIAVAYNPKTTIRLGGANVS